MSIALHSSTEGMRGQTRESLTYSQDAKSANKQAMNDLGDAGNQALKAGVDKPEDYTDHWVKGRDGGPAENKAHSGSLVNRFGAFIDRLLGRTRTVDDAKAEPGAQAEAGPPAAAGQAAEPALMPEGPKGTLN